MSFSEGLHPDFLKTTRAGDATWCNAPVDLSCQGHPVQTLAASLAAEERGGEEGHFPAAFPPVEVG